MSTSMDIKMFRECRGAHSHSYPQTMVPIQREMKIQIGEAEYDVTPRECCLIPAGMTHQCDYRGRLLVINLTDDLSHIGRADLLSVPMIVSMRGQVERLVELILAEKRQNPEGQAVQHLYSYFYSKLMENCVTPSLRYLTEHFDMPITVNQLAEIENYNVTYYNDWFKQQTGFSPYYYIRCLRISKAKELLQTTGMNVMEVAVSVGYSGNAAFTRAFRDITGSSPRQWRKMAEEQKEREDSGLEM